MTEKLDIRPREWGRTPIAGGRHDFRVAMILRELELRVRPPARALDAGCGDGSLTAKLIELGYETAAVDASSLCLARLVDRTRGGPGARVSLAGLEALPFADSLFDAVISGEVLEHLADDAAAAGELARVMKPGAILVVTVPADPEKWSMADEWAGHRRRYRPRELEALFDRAGLECLTLRRWGWPVISLYERWLFRFWLKRKLARGQNDPAGGEPAGLSPLAARLMNLAFSADRLFVGAPWGIGLVGVFKKPA